MNTEKDIWLGKLAAFIVIANGKTWAADGAEVDPQRPGYKELQWPYLVMSEQDKQDYAGWEDWLLRDSYTGYFRAPGMTTVYYKNRPVWAQSYGGPGMKEGHEALVKPTFDFLKEALMKVTPKLPFRGPEAHLKGSAWNGWVYSFEHTGSIEDATWTEHIIRRHKFDLKPVFTQTGFAGTIVHRTEDRKPLYPWEL